MTSKVPGSHLAVGYWGRNPYCRITGEQTADKIKALEIDKLIAMGRPVFLWLLVNEDTDGVVPCTCTKETNQASDFRCMGCYGTKYIPGYEKFLHDTLHFSSSEEVASGTYTLTSMEVDYSVKPNRVRLVSGALTGTIETPDKAFANPDGADWEIEVAAYRKQTTDTVAAEFSTDGGGTWTDVSLINGANKPTGSGSVRFRVALTRAASTTESPDFEILRIRRLAAERLNPVITTPRPDTLGGQILLLRTWYVERTQRTLNVGRQTDWTADKAWTAPLDVFDTTITADTPAARIRDEDAGPHPFYEHAFGVETGTRLPIYQISLNEQLLTFTHQAFFDRKAQPGEMYHLVL